MTAAERMVEVADLRAAGLTYRQVADRLGISHGYAKRLGSPRSYESSQRTSREAKLRRTGTCALCGATTKLRRYGAEAAEVCGECAPTHYGQIMSATRRGHGPVVERALAFLAEPRRTIEIRDHLGVSSGYVSMLLYGRLKKYGFIRRVSRGVWVATDSVPSGDVDHRSAAGQAA